MYQTLQHYYSNSSVPRNDTTDTRPAVVLSMKRLDTHFPIDNGKRVVCLAGCGISTLATSISSWFPDRESHSILGSTFLNPTTAAGVAFGSGGVYVRKGPARTDRALYCKDNYLLTISKHETTRSSSNRISHQHQYKRANKC